MCTTNSFTKEMFKSLHMDWNQMAKSREVLDEMIPREESVGTILEDVIFSLSQFLEFLIETRKERKIAETSINIETFIICEDLSYYLHIGNSDCSQVAFLISCEEDSYSFRNSINKCGSKVVKEVSMSNLEEVKEVIILYFNEFYIKVGETML